MKLTVTSVLFQPAAFAEGETEALMVGAVLSRLITTDAEAIFPAASVPTPEIV
jgi:hypothetical protein